MMKDVDSVATIKANCDSSLIQSKRNLYTEGSRSETRSCGGVRLGIKMARTVPGKDFFLYCEGWSNAILGISWLSHSRTIFIYQESLDETLLKRILPKRIVFLNQREALNKIDDLNTISIIVGSLIFVEDVINLSGRFPLIRTLVMIPYCRFRKRELVRTGLSWIKISHSAIGGVTTSAWSMGYPKRYNKPMLQKLCPSFGLARSLKHVYKDGLMGKVTKEPGVNLLDQLVSLNDLQSKTFALPSFRSHSGWVNRKLDNFELGLTLDYNELILKKIILEAGEDATELILSSIPGKVTQIMHDFIALHWGQLSSSEVNTDEHAIQEDVGNLLLPDVAIAVKPAEDLFLAQEAAYLIDYGQKAAKSDDAVVPVELWDRCVLRDHFDWLPYSQKVADALDVLRTKFAWRMYIINLVRSFFRYLKKTYGYDWWRNFNLREATNLSELKKDLAIGLDSLRRALNSTWWEWTDGSTCYFWRWPEMVRTSIRDGFKICVEKKLPEYKKRQMFKGLTPEQMNALELKVKKVIHRKYLNKGYVKSLINYFAVPKGADDIRVVYDGTKSGLTDSVWAPNFYMPSVDSILLYCSPKTWYSDLDLGEMFLNYFMDSDIRPFCGVDVSRFSSDKEKQNGTHWMQWNRMFMGFRASPYYAVKSFSWGLDVVRGNYKDPSNAFAFDSIRLNLPGSSDYDPTLPWLSKMQKGEEANDVIPYMDDGRPHGGSEKGCRSAGKQTSKITQYLGQQDASRKYRPPSQQPGPWCGAFMAAKNGSLWVYVSDDKWRKAKAYIKSWRNKIAWCLKHSTPPVLDFKDLERGRGFLVYLSRTYPSIVPYLKGLHLTIDSWRPLRDEEGWKAKKPAAKPLETLWEDDDLIDFNEEELLVSAIDHDGNLKESSVDQYMNHPEQVSIVPRMTEDLNALNLFFAEEKPTWRFVRGSEICVAEYGFGDASGSGFGSSYQTNAGIRYRFGIWGRDTQGESSNFRELANLVDSLYDRATADKTKLKGLEVFLFTDNAVAEGAFYKGTSSSKKLFELILKLRLLEMKEGFLVHIIHIAGTRMISQGSDGLSRGDANEGVMTGRSMLDFVPISKTCFARSPLLKKQIEYCLQPLGDLTSQRIHFLSELDWFVKGHDIREGKLNDDKVWIPSFESAIYVWSPAPAAGQHAIEQLRQARLKRTVSTHIFLIPRIFTSLWRKQAYKCSDLIIKLPFDNKLWIKDQHHEPLTICFLFPFLNVKPWQLKRTYAFLGMGRVLRRMWEESSLSQWDILRKLCAWAGRITTMSNDLVWEMLQSASAFELFCRKA